MVEKKRKRGRMPYTQKGDNWTVAVLKCPRANWIETFRNLFSTLESHSEFMIPHYTIRSSDGDSLFVSIRVLRRKKDKILVESKIANFLKDCEFEIDPEQENRFYKYHAWTPKGKSNNYWTKGRCEILSKISRFILEIVDSDTSLEDRIDWGHLFSNMMAVFDKVLVFMCPETARYERRYYLPKDSRVRIHTADYLEELVRELIKKS